MDDSSFCPLTQPIELSVIPITQLELRQQPTVARGQPAPAPKRKWTVAWSRVAASTLAARARSGVACYAIGTVRLVGGVNGILFSEALAAERRVRVHQGLRAWP
jgi:hypothetical protein